MADDELLQRQFDEDLDREGGAFMEKDGREAACEPDEEPCAPDDYVNDPETRSPDVPGTIDDQPYTFGIENPAPADEHLELEGATKPSGETRESAEVAEDQGAADERELVDDAAVIATEETSAIRLEGFPEEEIPDIMAALGDDAADALSDNPDGTSATGAWSQPEHGGFPERKE
jgi:hypothetical protein